MGGLSQLEDRMKTQDFLVPVIASVAAWFIIDQVKRRRVQSTKTGASMFPLIDQLERQSETWA